MPQNSAKPTAKTTAPSLQAYGFIPKMTESEIVAVLFKMYERLTKENKKQTDLFAPNGTLQKAKNVRSEQIRHFVPFA